MLVDFDTEAEQERLATPCPHPTPPLVGPEVPSVVARLLPPSRGGRDRGEAAPFSLQARRALPVAVRGLERRRGPQPEFSDAPPPEFSDAPPAPLAARLRFALSRRTHPSVNSRHSVRC